ncbi:hypothetical protein [Nocardia sp. NBC_01009]|uniref:hypothetical protein n=1 Tax=Nocardia sp. NBC_01009 TaxID=2975996 RepID=UPI003869E557
MFTAIAPWTPWFSTSASSTACSPEVARLGSRAAAGTAPRTMGIGLIPATEHALTRAGLTLVDMDVIEQRSLRPQVLAVLRHWNLEPDNPLEGDRPMRRASLRQAWCESADRPAADLGAGVCDRV